MSLIRPKRKATANKNYVDSASESLFDLIISSSNSSSKSLSGKPTATTSSMLKSPRKKPSISNGKLLLESATPPFAGKKSAGAFPEPSKIVPYNWQPPLSPGEEFSHKLDLTDATINTVFQTLTCPRHSAAMSVQREEHELKELQALLVQNLGKVPVPFGLRRKPTKTCLQIKKGDYIYMVSEPPGEPYYIGRVTGFKRKDENQDEQEVESATNYMFQIQWFYRPRDILKHTLDSRLLFASMHSDTCPLSSFRGLLTVLHKLDVETYFQPPTGSQLQWSSALEFYSSFPNCFYFDKLYDRYILKFFDVVKTSTLLRYINNTANCSKNYILALNKRFEFVSMESARTKLFLNNFTSTMSTHCDICAEWCGLSDSVTCAGCEKHFHMFCLDPPLMKKPSRGFSWSCALCTKKHELEYQSRKMLMLSHDNRSTNEEEISSTLTEPVLPPEVSTEEAKKPLEGYLPKYEKMAIEYLEKDALVSVLERRLKEEWNIRYLGLHARLEEAMDLFDKSYYPRVSTSLGQRYQASNIPECDGHPIVYYDPDQSVSEKNKKKNSSNKKPTKKKIEIEHVKELHVPKEFEGVSPKDFPQWLQPRPKGYIERGVDDGNGETCTLMWKSSPSDIADNFQRLDLFIASQDSVAERLGLHPNSPNFADGVVKAYLDCEGDTSRAAEIVSHFTRASLKEPTFTKEEVRRFEAGVKKHGSELYPVSKEVKSQPTSMIVRFYYIWKKTQRGHLIWGGFAGRKKKPNKDVEMKIKPAVDDYADSEDDSAYENEKIIVKKKTFQCKHCTSYTSQKWFKITGFDGTSSQDEKVDLDDLDPSCIIALCFRCAKIWRRYAVYWEDPVEVERKNSRGVGGYRKKVESELVVDSEKILRHARQDGAALSYDVGKKHPESSVIGGFQRSSTTNTYQKTPATISQLPKTVKMGGASIPKEPTNAPSLMKTASRPRKGPNEVNGSKEKGVPDLKALGEKATDNHQEEPASKRKKIEKKSASEPPKVERSKKRQIPTKSEPASKSKKKKVNSDVQQTEDLSAVPEQRIKEELDEASALAPRKQIEAKIDAKNAPTRRQRKTADVTVLANPIFNSNYKTELEDALQFLRNDKRGLSPLTTEVLKQVLDGFKLRQLLDMKQLVQGWQAPQNAKIDFPFTANDRNCSICLVHDSSDTSSQETLICSNCGVNVHGSCAGIAISGKNRPVKQWLCDICVNDLGPKFNTSYSCSICLAKSTNKELAILGSSLEKPDYLIPVIESGTWCHMICALYCYQQVSFRQLLSPTFVSKDITNSTVTNSLGCVVESVSRVFAENFDHRCEICKCFNGGLINCDLCSDKNKAYHVTCAQDTPNFKLGFKLSPERSTKLHTSTTVKGQCGKLEPILVCPDHEQKGAVLSPREHGKRSSAGDLRPLIQLFIEDLMRSGPKLNGPQLKANNYISMIETFMEKFEAQKGRIGISMALQLTQKSCWCCKITSSPKWWPVSPADEYTRSPGYEHLTNVEDKFEDTKLEANSESSVGPQIPKQEYECQKCHVLGPDKEPIEAIGGGDYFMNELVKPLRGDAYGVTDVDDFIKYVPYELKAPVVERSQITWGDLLG